MHLHLFLHKFIISDTAGAYWKPNYAIVMILPFFLI